ncbi:hypothetical protein [Streptomyces violaceusniger]|uniref:Uncharacterized protein n=1 Tax=Streptomyces violaceusniger TaxID=68280 RepID=A0A4D4KMA1_STRVO|nr:hypothetical protein SVIO_006580 [Streptomyces violaceusniger]
MADQLELSAALSRYIREFSLREDAVLAELREQTSHLRRGTPTPKGSARSTRWSATTPAWRCH